jgi:two-component system cell cycle response regulator
MKEPATIDRQPVPRGASGVHSAVVHEESRCHTPLLPVAPPRSGDGRPTLTLLTGLHAGRIVVIDGASLTLGRDADVGLVVDDCGVSGCHARIGRTREGSYFVEDLLSTNGTFVGSDRVRVASLHDGDVLQLGPTVRFRFAVIDSREVSLYRRLYDSSMRDPLTRTFNRTYLADRLFAETARARRTDRQLGILMVDVDCMKEVNDHFGHLAGDRALCAISLGIQRTLRVEDLLGRYGGDEFVVVAIDAGRVEALGLADRVRRAIGGLHTTARGQRVTLTVSIGVASLLDVAPCDDVAALLARADQRLYAAKAAGKNRVCAWDTPSW